MNSDFVYASVVIVGLVWWLWRLNKNAQSESTKNTVPIETASTDIDASHSDDSFLAQISKERINAEKNVKQLSEQFAQSIDVQVREDEALKLRLSKFAKENKLDLALIQLWEEIKHYPTWSMRADFNQYDKLKFDAVGETTELTDKSIWFVSAQKKFTIKTRAWSGFESDSYQDFTLLEDDQEVFSICTLIHYDTYMTTFAPMGVNVFKRRGTWALMLIDAFAKLELARQKSTAEQRARMAMEIRAKFSE